MIFANEHHLPIIHIVVFQTQSRSNRIIIDAQYCIMSLTVNLSDLNLDMKTMQKMIFIHNCLEKGWTVKKRENRYIFQKNHEGKKEVFMEDYLDKFINDNLTL
jgi:hypothetical protein